MGEVYKNSIVLCASNKNLNGRWSLIDKNEVVNEEFTWIHKEFQKEFKRVSTFLGYDNLKQKEVIIKTVRLSKSKDYKEQREILKNYTKTLNDIKSPFLPQLLDFFYLKENNNIQCIKKNEPMIILEYKKGRTLEEEVLEGKFKEAKNNEANMLRIVEIMKKTLGLSKYIEEKGYVHLGISPEHIIIGENDEVSFLGLGRICEVKNGVLNSKSVNFSRSLYGYSAPELNNIEFSWGENSKPAEIIAFSLGVLLHQLVCGSINFSNDSIREGAFYYPNNKSKEIILKQRNGYRLHDFLEKLCNHQKEERLKNYEEIESILDELTKERNYYELTNKPFIAPEGEETIYKNLVGYISSFNKERKHGFVRSDKGEEFYLRFKEIEEFNLKNVREGLEIEFDVVKDSTGEIFVSNIKDKSYVVIDVEEKYNTEVEDDELEEYYEYEDEASGLKVFGGILRRIRKVLSKS
ncbi:protein kinase domain-containing protein [Clostridium massiliamazoniense]|uniref:protein kinase domain-containing protein n=1 Tax=Clostridium massiliamazoniense TaxID=1347366 RepID=UPI0006D7A077|nr:cold shock domain-containing protein [Clostridium massiliamazoniense]